MHDPDSLERSAKGPHDPAALASDDLSVRPAHDVTMHARRSRSAASTRLARARRGGGASASRAVALCLALVIAAPAASVPASAAPDRTATLSGRAYRADDKLPAEGAVVKAVHIISQRVFTSPPSDDSGRFDLKDLPTGYYDIGIELGGSLFVAGTVVNLSGGGRVSLDFILQAYGDTSTEWWQGQKREIAILGQEQGIARVTERSRGGAGGKSFWKKPGGIAIIVVGGLGVIAAAAGGGGGGGGSDGGGHASRSTP